MRGVADRVLDHRSWEFGSSNITFAAGFTLTKLKPATPREQVERTSSKIAEIIGNIILVMRPPYGATSGYINYWTNREFGMRVIFWSVDPLD
jgi:hypothetical protein